jgi:L-asparaginase
MHGIKSTRPLQFTQLCMEDSRTVTNDHRAQLVTAIDETESRKIIVTHGNFTIRESASFVKQRLRPDNQKVIVFTGASLPLENMTLSDGGFNLGYAFAQVDVLNAGVYICVGGRVYSPNDTIEYLDQKLFVSKVNR